MLSWCPAVPPEKPGASRSLRPFRGTRQGVCGWLLERKRPCFCRLVGCGSKRGWGCGDLPTLPLRAAPPSRPVPLGAPCPLGLGGGGVRPAGKGGSPPRPPPRFFGAAEGTCARPRRGAPGARSPSLMVRGPLTSRHAGAHHGAAGPGRCALGAPGRRALMSPRARGSRAALAQRKRGRAEKGPGLRSAQPPLPPGRPRQRRRRSARLASRRRLASRARPCQTRAARRAGRPRGALAPSPEPRARSPRGRSAPSAPAACRPVAAARPRGGGGVSRSPAGGGGEGEPEGELLALPPPAPLADRG